MARTRIQEFPFTAGQNESADAKLLPDGLLTRAKNVRLRKDGRFGVRADYDAVSNNTINSANLVPYDLIGFDESLLAIGDGNGYSSDTAAWDIAELVSTTPGTWRLSSQAGAIPKLATCVNIREIPALPSSIPFSNIGTVSRVDCAASGGFVCVAMQSGTGSVVFHILRASTGATIFTRVRTGIRPRVVAVGSVFFLLSLNTAGTTLRLESFDPNAHTSAQTHTDITSGTTVACYDAVTDLAGTGFWVAYNLSTPTTTIVPVNSSGTMGSAITGPAVAYQHVAVRQTTTRVHLLSVIAGGALELRSYTTGGVLSTGPTTVDTVVNDRQPGLTSATFSGTEAVEVVYEQVDTATFPFVGTCGWQKLNALTHALFAVTSSDPLSVRNGYLGSKPVVGGSINFQHLFAFVRPDGDFLSHGLRAADDNSDGVTYAYKDRFAAVASNADTTPQIALDSSTSKLYWPNLYLGADGLSWPRLTEFQFAGSARRQAAAIGGILYVGGALIQTFDGRSLVENYFFDKPQILSAVASNGAGSLPTNTSLLVAAVYEWVDKKGNIRQSDISTVETVTMGAADDTIDLQITVGLGNRGSEGPVTVVAYRSTSGVNQLRRAESTTYTTTTTGAVTLTLVASDATVRANGVIYTQGGRGALSGTTPHEPAFPADYIWKFGSRLLAANADQAFVSRELFPGEAVTWSQEVGFTIPKISERIRGVAALDTRGLIFTAENIYAFAGDGPNDLGEGRYGEPLKLPSSVGLEDWRSLVETPIGLFFQGSNGQLWVLPRDGSPPDWIGVPVRDTLVSYPVVTSATLVTEEQLVCFTCNNTGLTDARIVCYDLRAKTWIVDEFASSTPIKSACSYQGRLAILSAGVVYTEKTSLTPGTFIEHGLTTGTIKPFDWGKVCRFGLIGEYRGDCDIYARISHDDGKTYTTMSKIQQLRSASYAVGDTVDVEWTPSRWKTDGFRLDFSARTAGSATEGFVFNSYWIETMTERRGARRASTYRG